MFLENLGVRLTERNGESISTYPKAVVYAHEKNAEPNPYGGVIKLPYENRTITLDGAQSYDDTGIVSYQWDLGNGETKAGALVEHTFNRTGTYLVRLKVTDGEIDSNTGEGKSDVSAPQRVEVLPPEYDFVKIRYKADGEGFAQEGRMLNDKIDIRRVGNLRRIRGTSQFLDENNQPVTVSVKTSFPVFGFVVGNIAFSNPDFSKSINFASINPVTYDASTNTFSLKVEEMELHFTEKSAAR